MSNAEIWDEAAAAYDTPGRGMFARSVPELAAARPEDLARGGRALEFAIGTGRVVLTLQANGLPVAEVEIAPAMLAQLRTKVSKADMPVVQVFRTPHRHVWPEERDLMEQLAGSVLESRHADWAGGAFAGASRRHVSVYRRGRA